MQIDTIMTTLMFSNINKVSTGHWLLDLFFTALMMISIKICMSDNFKNNFNIILSYISGKQKINMITFSASTKEQSNKYKALMHLISQSNDPTVKALSEIEIKKYNSRLDDYDEVCNSVYRVSQATTFKINDNINGKVYWSSKDKTELNGKIQYVEYQNLEISSKNISLRDLTDWVNDIEKKYKTYVKNKMLDTQTLVEISWDSKENYMSVFYAPWQSNVTFDNRFFTGKKEILDKIHFFLSNEDWYKERGIPYTLGILLWGEPGCGKTGFIKALMNLTKRHGIDIKLSKKFNMNSLREVICDDEINSDIIIPQNNRILLFEDIDAMGDVVKDRDLPKEQQDIDIDAKIKEVLFKKSKRSSRKSIDDNDSIFQEASNDNNNLSYFLNILDGLHECPGRIIIMTTNKPEYLDKALIRPGRIDFKLNMTKASIEDIKDILNFYWKTNKCLLIDAHFDKKLSHADIISCCRLSSNIDESIIKIGKKSIDNDSELTLTEESNEELIDSCNSEDKFKSVNEDKFNSF